MKKVEINDLLQYRFPSGLTYSPDGKLLAYEVSYADEKKNDYRHDIHLIRDGKDTQLTSTLNASLLFWEDDSHLVLKRSTDETEKGTTDLYIIDVNGGEAVKWLSLPLNAGSIKKIHDHLYAVAAVFDSHDPDLYLQSEEERKKKQEEKEKNHEKDYQVVDEVPYWFNNVGFTNGFRTGLFILETEPFRLTRITSNLFGLSSYRVEGNKVYFTGMEWQRSQPLYDNLYCYDAEEKKVKDIYTKGDRSIGGIFMIGDTLYVQESDMKEYGVNETRKVAKVTENGFEELFKPEYSLYSSVVGDTLPEDGKSYVEYGDGILFNTTVEDHNELRLFDADLNSKIIFTMKGQIGDIDTNGKEIAFTCEDWNHLGEVHVIDMDGRDERVLTHLNDANLADHYVAEPVRLDYESAGNQLHGWVLLPENFDANQKYPAVLDVHGGPRCVYGEMFFHEMQVWAAKGYVVMFTNIRGSDGRGDAFADIRDQYGFVDYQNLMDFVDAVLVKYPNIDASRLCETGGSYGGFMSNWIMTHTDRFCAIASQRSISNWVSMSFISDIGLYFGPDQCGGDGLFGKKNTELLWKHSPLAYADNVKTPSLFIHSDEDYRCPLPEGMQMMQALAVRGVETRMCIFHGENHELSRSGKPLHRIRRLEEITKWFDNHTA